MKVFLITTQMKEGDAMSNTLNRTFADELEVTIKEDIMTSYYLDQLLDLIGGDSPTEWAFEKSSIAGGFHMSILLYDQGEPCWYWLTQEYGWISSKYLYETCKGVTLKIADSSFPRF